jgi:HPt (histidine-containing phosphotransfer) domain-containing protein
LPARGDRKTKGTEIDSNKPAGRSKCIDLTYLYNRTKNNPELMLEMIALYLVQTPELINRMKLCLAEKNWDSLYGAAHKIIPSFSIMGMNKDFETMAKMIQEYSASGKQLDKIEGLVMQIDTICSQACLELKEEYKLIEINKK